jgi:creatinine amidohydrolase
MSVTREGHGRWPSLCGPYVRRGEGELLAAGAYALLPTGAVEAHGPHLPLGTDVVIAEGARPGRTAALLAKEDRIHAYVLPSIAYAVTEYASDFAGTMSLPEETAMALVRDVILAAMRTGFRGVVVCNAHLEPANIGTLKRAVEEANARGAVAAFPDVTRKPHALRLGEEFRSGACHAGCYETSLVLAADARLVRADIAKGLAENPASLSTAIRAGKKTFVEAGGPDAYFGAPAAASVAEGQALYAELGAIFAGAVRDLA